MQIDVKTKFCQSFVFYKKRGTCLGSNGLSKTTYSGTGIKVKILAAKETECQNKGIWRKIDA
jgi:hypothetical protein